MNVKEGDNVILNCITSAVPPVNISWYKNGTLLSHNADLALNGITSEDTAEYMCKTKNNDSEKSSSTYLMVKCTFIYKLKCMNFS